MNTRATVALLAGLAISATAAGIVLSRSPLTLAGTNGISEGPEIADRLGVKRVCQAGETLPSHTAAVRLLLNMSLGPKVTLEALAGTQVISSGSRAAGWRGADVTVGVKPLARTVSDVTICALLGPTHEQIGMLGAKSSPARAAVADGQRLRGRLAVEYLRPASASWLTSASTIAHRVSLGNSTSALSIGASAPLLILMAILALLTCWLVIREP